MISSSERVARWRASKKLTFVEASELTGISPGVLQKIEAGTLRVTDRSARKLADAMGLKRWWLLCEEPKQRAAS